MDVSNLMPEPKGFVAFSGSGVRLDGRKKKNSESGSSNLEQQGSSTEVNNVAPREYVRGIPDYDYQLGSLRFIRGRPPRSAASVTEEDGAVDNGNSSFKAFKGQGQSLRASKNKK